MALTPPPALCLQLMESAAHTFELLLLKAVEENPEHAASATDKTKHRVLKVSSAPALSKSSTLTFFFFFTRTVETSTVSCFYYLASNYFELF